MLTIAIPTYNRPAQLRATVAKVAPQLDGECRLLVIDNASPTPATDVLRDVLASVPNDRWQILRNRTNIGGAANVLRCFEMCETPWIWVLGDDDYPLPDAVATIRRQIQTHPDAAYFNFRTELFHRTESFVTRGAFEFVDRIDSFSNALLLSTNLFDARAALAQLKFGYTHAYSCAPQLVIVIRALVDATVPRECVFLTDQIVRWAPAPQDQRWSTVNVNLAAPTLLDMPLPPELRARLAEQLDGPNGLYTPLAGIARQLLFVARADGDGRSARFLFDQTVARRYALGRPLRAWAEVPLLRALLRIPRVGLAFANAVAHLVRGTAAGENQLQSRTERM
jgi:DNA polymerase III psi subunit